MINRVGKELAEDPEYSSKIIDPPLVLRVDNFGESSIELKIIGETAPIEQWGIMGELRLRLRRPSTRRAFISRTPSGRCTWSADGASPAAAMARERRQSPSSHSGAAGSLTTCAWAIATTS